jgi:hypothetical protein
VVRVRVRVGVGVRGCVLKRLKMINVLRTINSESTSGCLFSTDAKAKLSLFTDKQAFQQVKTTGGAAMQLKRAVSFTLRPLYS